jgi:hypothetical protein
VIPSCRIARANGESFPVVVHGSAPPLVSARLDAVTKSKQWNIMGHGIEIARGQPSKGGGARTPRGGVDAVSVQVAQVAHPHSLWTTGTSPSLPAAALQRPILRGPGESAVRENVWESPLSLFDAEAVGRHRGTVRVKAKRCGDAALEEDMRGSSGGFRSPSVEDLTFHASPARAAGNAA